MGIFEEPTFKRKMNEAKRQLENKKITLDAYRKRLVGSSNSGDSGLSTVRTQDDINKALDNLERQLPGPYKRPLSQGRREILKQVPSDEIDKYRQDNAGNRK